MKKIFYFIALVTLSLLFVQCETKLEGGENGVLEGHEYVDLGLSVKWATCNIGANSPEEAGDYFAWGEVEPKEYYDWSTYKYCVDYEQLTKYCDNSSYGKDGFTDSKTVLDPEDDAATANWGGAWRMPTKEELLELRTECKLKRTTLNGVKGYKVTGPNGNSIFLPAAGYMDGGTLYDAGSRTYYWSNLVIYYGVPTLAEGVDFKKPGNVFNCIDRCYGLSVRPVCW